MNLLMLLVWPSHMHCSCSYEYSSLSCKQDYHQQEHDLSHLILLKHEWNCYNLTATCNIWSVKDLLIKTHLSCIGIMRGTSHCLCIFSYTFTVYTVMCCSVLCVLSYAFSMIYVLHLRGEPGIRYISMA